MTILHFSKINNSLASGIANVVPEHISEQAKLTKVLWCNFLPDYKRSNATLDYISLQLRNILKLRFILQDKHNIKLAVFHGFFYIEFFFASLLLRFYKIPYIIVPHGSLTEKALNQKKVKKIFGCLFFFNSFLYNAKAIQFLTKGEAEASKKKYNNKSFIVPNGIHCKNVFVGNKGAKNPIVGVFISRKNVYYKGLDILLEACGKVKNELATKNVLIKIYGPDRGGSEDVLRDLVKKHELSELVEIYDEVYGIKKEKVYLDSDFFILTSRSEGHPTAVLEALTYGLPCLVTTETNMGEEIEEYNAGWHCKCDVQSVAKALEQAVEDVPLYNQYSKNAKILAENYDWPRIASLSIKQYQDLYH